MKSLKLHSSSLVRRPTAVVLGMMLASLVNGLGEEPTITRQPTNQSVSIGATAAFRVTATTTNPPVTYQWRFALTNYLAATNATLSLTNVQLADAGDYDVIVGDASASVTSQVAHLDVDATFTKIMTGPIVSDRGSSAGGTWGDYNNDGFPDLFVFNSPESGLVSPFLYRNNADGTFAKVSSGAPVDVAVNSVSASWGDYDNDGNPDLLVANTSRNVLYHNNGDATFTRITGGPLLTDSANHLGVSWIDYDQDGLLDVFTTVFDPGAGSRNVLYRNAGDGAFTRITTGSVVTDVGSSLGCVWGDYDNDGYVDLFVAGGRGPDTGIRQPNRLYHNNGDGTFTRVTEGSIATDLGYSGPCAWGDYDNDGFLDLFVGNTGGVPNFLYHNNGNGSFTRITNGAIATDVADSFGCAWGDYDNDGFLDLFVGNAQTAGGVPEVSFLYHNNGDGTFKRIATGSPSNDPGDAYGCTWADYDNDGFLDLFVSRNNGQGNYLYHNQGNSNRWLTVKLVGTVSNRAAIGARVRVKATIGGTSRWQLRQITGGGGWGSGSELVANFGLGDATNVDFVRIEWPSGIVQTLTNVAPKQILNVVEHQEPGPSSPVRFTGVSYSTAGAVELSVAGGAGLRYLFEGSTNLVNWTWLGVRTNLTGAIQFTDAGAANASQRFYRASVP